MLKRRIKVYVWVVDFEQRSERKPGESLEAIVMINWDCIIFHITVFWASSETMIEYFS